MKTNLFTLFIYTIGIFSANAQYTSEPYIEVAVSESIQLKIKSLEVNIFVRSRNAQMEEAKDREFYDDYYYYEEDYYYEYLLEESPKEITKSMKKEYEERQIERTKREEEMNVFDENFSPYSVKELMLGLDERNISYVLVLDYDNESQIDYEYYYDDYLTDSMILVTLINNEEFKKLSSFTEDNYATVELNGASEMESIEGKYEEMLPLLAKKAKEQGSLIAAALDQEIGGLLSCSNIHPSIDFISLDSAQEMMDFETDYLYYGNPFENGSEFNIGLVFRFKIN